jgi:hypothetical protein
MIASGKGCYHSLTKNGFIGVFFGRMPHLPEGRRVRKLGALQKATFAEKGLPST